jgi:hypothetical protein
MWDMASRTRVGVLFIGFAAIAACDDSESDVPYARTGSARGTDSDATTDDASRSGAGDPVVRVEGGGGQGAAADASALDGGPDASLDGGPDASLDGGPDASLDGGPDASLDGGLDGSTPSPMPIEDAAIDALVPTGGFGGFGGIGHAGGAAAGGGF